MSKNLGPIEPLISPNPRVFPKTFSFHLNGQPVKVDNLTDIRLHIIPCFIMSVANTDLRKFLSKLQENNCRLLDITYLPVATGNAGGILIHITYTGEINDTDKKD